MATPGTENDDWGDPYQILEEDRDPSREQRTGELQQELVSTYRETHTTTPLDSPTAFHVQQLDEQEDDTYHFRAKRFVGLRPAGTYTGTAVETDTGWTVTFDDDPHFVHRYIRWFKS